MELCHHSSVYIHGVHTAKFDITGVILLLTLLEGSYGPHSSFKCNAVSQRLSLVKAVSRFRWIAAGRPLIPRGSWFSTCAVNVELLVGKVVLLLLPGAELPI